ncbi:unnamed protein product [Cladocopium goreaui]|uniref:Uncharacterized protein n=1 Tax=Cladocopium goreaui TaxID=2562237 RepID=A0A9P1GMX3_9DINO|nr:unnamed protein product [Cladocopium goreaui]
MAPKATGGAGQKTAQDYVTGLWQQGVDEASVRQQLREDGYKAGKISQLIKATRPAQEQESRAAAAPKGMARLAGKSRSSSSALSREAAPASPRPELEDTGDQAEVEVEMPDAEPNREDRRQARAKKVDA